MALPHSDYSLDTCRTFHHAAKVISGLGINITNSYFFTAAIQPTVSATSRSGGKGRIFNSDGFFLFFFFRLSSECNPRTKNLAGTWSSLILAQLTCLVNHHRQLKQRTGRMTWTESTDSLAESRAGLLGFGFIIIIRDNSPAYINMSSSTLSLIHVLKVRIKVQYRR